ncbi:MAG TPA: RNA-binding domain-containing protein [Thermoplasmata archaeon]|nr:RNA-binding domain-containing protein [Thermoplasmata archaeon]
MHRVRVETPIHPTENPDKVMTALRSLFPDLRVESREGRIIGTTENLDRLRELIRNQRIRDTARRQLLAGRRGDRTAVSLSKQAAFVGVVNFAVSSPLGDITVEIESDDLEAAIDYVAESTLASRA